MRVAIIGSGGIGRGYFAYLTSQGHHPILWSPNGAARADFADTATLDVTGKLETSFRPVIARDCAEAVEGAEAIIIAVSANGFRAVLDQLAPHLANGQTVVISSHCSFAALYLHRQLTQRGLDLPVVAWATTALTARKSGPRSVHISGVRSKLDVATLPFGMRRRDYRFAERCSGTGSSSARTFLRSCSATSILPPIWASCLAI